MTGILALKQTCVFYFGRTRSATALLTNVLLHVICVAQRRGHKKRMQTIRVPQREPLVNGRIMHTLFAHLFLSLDLVSAHAIATMHEMRYYLEAPKDNFSVC